MESFSKTMRNKRVLTYCLLLLGFSLLPVFGEEKVLPETPAVTTEAGLSEAETVQAEKRTEKINQYLENLIFRILQEDTDTGELPEAGFSIDVNNQNLEKLIATGEKGKKYLFSLLKETKSGYAKERILRELARETAGKELDNFTLETLYSIIKDRSSGIRFLTVRLLGEKGTSKSIPKINSLLYDPFILRKDVYPIRTAAREAIELIKIREEAGLLPEEERVKKWLAVIKEKAAARQDYFCEKAAGELALLPAGKESVWTELIAAKEMVGKKTLINNKIFGYLLLASANLKDERTLPLIEESIKDLSLVNMAVRSAAALSPLKTAELLLKEPVNNINSALMLKVLKEQPVENTSVIALTYTGYDKESYDAVVKDIKQILLVKRDNEAYKDAAEMYAYVLNDFERALFYFTLYENGAARDEAYSELLAKTLANNGKFMEAEKISPLMDLKSYIVNRKLLEIFTGLAVSDPVLDCRKNYRLVNIFLEMKNYGSALCVLKKPELMACTEIPEQYIKEKTTLCEATLKEERDDILGGLDTALNENASLEISTEKQEYKKDEEIKVKLLLKNTGVSAASGINDPAGNYGFDILVMKDGRLIKRLKKELSVSKIDGETIPDLFAVDPGTALASEIIIFSAAEEKTEQDVEILMSYVGGPEIATPGKEWIKHPLVSNEIIIKILK